MPTEPLADAELAAIEERHAGAVLFPYGTEELVRSWLDVPRLLAEVERLREAIFRHREQKADDRCIEDDDRLYAALGDGIKCDRRVGDKEAMLRNCARFIDRRCEGGGWPSYAELEAENARLQAEVAELRALDEQRGEDAWGDNFDRGL